MPTPPSLERAEALALPPWKLQASGFALLVREEHGIGAVLFVDYARSPVGPYRELLYIPGVQRCLSGGGMTITRIYVSSQASAVCGRDNWAIPKELASFDVHSSTDETRIGVHDASGEVLQLRVAASRWSAPFWTGLVPRGWRTLVQHRGTEWLTTRPSAHGLVGLAQVRALRSDPRRFPALTPAQVLLAVHLDHVRLTFPAASSSLSTG